MDNTQYFQDDRPLSERQLKQIDNRVADLKWIDMNAEYYLLEDESKTPMKITRINNGVVRVESKNQHYLWTGSIEAMPDYLTIVK